MISKAKSMHVRVSTRKAREVASLVRGLQVESALNVLKFTYRKSAFYISKTIRSAIANAEANHNVRDMSNVIIGELLIEQGAPLKRFTPRAYGRASRVRKPTTHIKVQLVSKGDK